MLLTQSWGWILEKQGRVLGCPQLSCGLSRDQNQQENKGVLKATRSSVMWALAQMRPLGEENLLLTPSTLD